MYDLKLINFEFNFFWTLIFFNYKNIENLIFTLELWNF